LNVVVLSTGETTILGGRVLLDRGRGLVVETNANASARIRRGTRVILIYSAGDGVFTLRAAVTEALSPNRFYVMPASGPREMEKREYIRAEVTAPAALDVRGSQPGPLAPARVELSASGFRWFGAADVAAGDRVTLRVEVPGEEGRLLVLPADAVRVDRRAGSAEVAGRFVDVAPQDRDAVLRVVFQRRYAELGLQDEP